MMNLAINTIEPSEIDPPSTVIPFTGNNPKVLTMNQTDTLAEMPLLELKNVCKSYGEGNSKTQVLDNINLRIKKGEFIAIVGFSGSGKTTLISAIAGLIQVDSGEVLKQNKAINAPGPDRGVVFQNYSLMPWLTVFENVAIGLPPSVKPIPKNT
jgi:nitrate/nitrite transport system ATP-binding protein